MPPPPLDWATFDVEMYSSPTTTNTGIVPAIVDHGVAVEGAAISYTPFAAADFAAPGVADVLDVQLIGADLPALGVGSAYMLRFPAAVGFTGFIQLLGLRYVRKS